MSRDGLVVIDKPQGLTSHDVVARLRKVFATRRVGHGGTLDPMATGVLVIGVNGGTKALQFVADATKSYTATCRLGQSTTTDDAEGELIAAVDAAGVTEESIRKAFASQVGLIDQVPPQFSAISVDGVRSYKRARAGESTELASRPVTIHAIEVNDVRRSGQFVDVDFQVTCGKGTYIRAIARDVGAALGVGGHLVALRRVTNAGFLESEAASLESAEAGFIALAQALPRFLPVISITEAEASKVVVGARLPWRWEEREGAVAVVNTTGDAVLAIGYRTADEPALLAYHCVLA